MPAWLSLRCSYFPEGDEGICAILNVNMSMSDALPMVSTLPAIHRPRAKAVVPPPPVAIM